MALTLTVNDTGFHFSGRANDITLEKNKLLAPHSKMLHNYGVVLSIIPDEKQKAQIRQFCGCARVVHNDYIHEQEQHYGKTKTHMSLSDYMKTRLPELKKEKPFLAQADKFALAAGAEHAENAFQRFFKKQSGYPAFSSKKKPSGNHYTTKYTNGNLELCFNGEGIPCVKLPKIGKVPFVLPKGKALGDVQPEGVRITKATVSCYGEVWTVSLSMESIIDLVEPFKALSLSSIFAGDAGLKEFLVYGTGDWTEHVPNPRFIKIHEKKLRRYQQKLARRQYDPVTKKGSRNREKARLLVAKEQRKIANQRKDFQHKLSRKIADRCMVFIKEDLNIKGMMKNHCLAKAIASVGWYGFFGKLSYKLKRKGGQVISVGRFFPSSQQCSHCGYKNAEVKDLKVREWDCPVCGAHHDRDVNAKENLLHEGIKILEGLGYTITKDTHAQTAAA